MALFLRFSSFWVALLFGIAPVLAQDSHYWNQQLGIKANLLGGAVVAGMYDNSAVYYNPAALAFVDQTHLSFNNNAYKVEELMYRDGAGENLDLFSRRLNLNPPVIGGMLTHDTTQPLKLGFAIFTRHFSHFDINQRYEQYTEVFRQRSGPEYYLGAVEFQDILNETWAGLGAGYRLNAHWALGGSLFLSYRNQRYQTSVYTRAAGAVDSSGAAFLASYNYHDAIRLNDFKLIPRVALHGRWASWRLGLHLTTPSINLYGFSRVQREVSYYNIPNRPNIMLIDQQRMLPTHYRSPLSAAAGLSYQFKKAWLGASLEYFAPIGLYKVIEATPRVVAYPSNQANATDFLSIYNWADQVLNCGIGYEQQVKQDWKLQMGFRTDFSYLRKRPDETKTYLLSPNLDLYHFSTGLAWQRKVSILSLGLNYTYGRQQNVPQFVNFANPSGADSRLMGGIENTAQAQNQSLTLLLGFTYLFAKN
jgi:hypothetical protein